MFELEIANCFFPYVKNIKKNNLTKELYNDLEKVACNHAIMNSKKRETKKVIVLIYPFKFLELSNDIKKRKSKEINKYFSNLKDILINRRGDYTLALLEDVMSYVSYSEFKLAQKPIFLFDEIILTKPNSIKPLNKNSLFSFFNKEIYIGGCYNGSYLSEAINKINCKAKAVYAIKDLSIEAPENSATNILSKKVYDWSDDLIESIPIKKFIIKDLE